MASLGFIGASAAASAYTTSCVVPSDLALCSALRNEIEAFDRPLILGLIAAFAGANSLVLALLARAYPGNGRASPAPDARSTWRAGVGWALIFVAIVFAVAVPVLDLLQTPQTALPAHSHEATGSAPIEHSPDAIAVAVELVPTLVIGLGLVVPGSLTSKRGFALLGGLGFLYADGLLHYFAILEHIGAVPFMWFFAVSGAVQIFAIPFALRWERVAWWSGVALSVFFLVLYAEVLVVPEPLSLEPEGVTQLGLLSKAAELGILGGTAGYFGMQTVPAILRRPLQNRGFVELLLAGSFLTVAIGGVESLWGLLPISVFLLSGLLVVLFILSLTVAHLRRNVLATAATWVVAFALVLGHLLYAAYYAGLGLFAPLSLCILGATSLAAPALVASITLRPPAAHPPLIGQHSD